METARSELPAEGTSLDHPPEGEAQVAQEQNRASSEGPAEVTQSTTDQTTPAPDAEGAAASGLAADADGGERSSVLSEFLADGPPRIEEGMGQEAGDRRPVQLEREQTGTPPEPADEAPPRETAADVPALDSGGSSFYDDDVGSVVPPLSETLLPSDLAGDPILPDGADPLLVEQFEEPLVLTSLAGVELVGPVMDAPTPALEPPPTDPDPDTDPLTERRLAAGEDINGGDASGDGGGAAAGVVVAGGDDPDNLSGGPGNDTLTGGGGQDVFSFSTTGDEGNDVVTDFETGSDGDIVRLTDVMDSDGNGAVELADLDDVGGNTVSGSADSLVLGFASGASLTLSGVDGSGLNSFDALEASNVNVDVA